MFHLCSKYVLTNINSSEDHKKKVEIKINKTKEPWNKEKIHKACLSLKNGSRYRDKLIGMDRNIC
ncbi:hypothetical protein B6N13_15300 [Marinomonas sp. UCMA 3892]|nr:hypothetical protein [Marinomonas sp. UCMA 3892]